MTSRFVQEREERVLALMRVRGQALWRTGAVDLLDLEETYAEAVVADRARHRVTIAHLERADCEWACSCGLVPRNGGCAHIWATVLEVDRLLTEIDEQMHSLAAEALGDESVASAAKARRGPDWRKRLAAIAPPQVGPADLPHLEYYVTRDLGGLGDGDGMTVHLRARFARKDGTFGLPRQGSLRREVVAALPIADRTLLALYARDTRRGHAYLYGYGQALAQQDVRLAAPWCLDGDALAAIVPWLAQAERVFHGLPPAHDGVVPRLSFDTAEPFRFEVDIDKADGRDMVEVRGVLRRGETVIPAQRFGDLPAHGFALLGESFVRVEAGGGEPLLRELARGSLRVPADEAGELLRDLSGWRGARQFLTAALEHLPVTAPLGIVSLRLPKAPLQPVSATLAIDYAGTSVPCHDESPLVATDAGVVRRDLPGEQQIVAALTAAGLQPTGPSAFTCERAAVPALTLTLCRGGLRVLAEGRPLRSFVDAYGSLRSGVDWLEVGGSVEFDGHRATFPELLRRIVRPDGFVELGDGSYGLLPEIWVRRIASLRLLGGDVDGETVRVPPSQALLLDAMLEARDGDAFTVDRAFAKQRERLAAFRRVPAAVAPASFAGELRGYQREGLGWLQFLRDFGLGGCLADDMGLGKTVQVLALLAGEHAPGRRARRLPSLLVAPRSVLSNWQAEAKRFAPKLRVLDFSQADRWQDTGPDALAAHDLVLTTYAVLRADAPRFAEAGTRFHYAILDESQMAKNAQTQTSKAARLLMAQHRLALSGTPVENHIGELWSLFEFLNPGMFGRLPAFRALFDKDITVEAMAEQRALVQRALRPVLLRRTKAQVLDDLPPKVEQTLWCELEPAQQRRYDELRQHFRATLLEGSAALDNQQRMVVLEALLRLRQAACHEGLLDPTRRKAASAKFDVLLPRLQELSDEGHKVLVFSQFVKLLDLVQAQLDERGIVYERLDGQTRNRAERVERFQEDPTCRVFLISLKAGGFGLNLTAADYVFLLDPWWNPAAELQAIDRAHRIGQRSTVHAYRIVARGTVEERVLELQDKKRGLYEAILGDDQSLLKDLTRGDLELLLG